MMGADDLAAQGTRASADMRLFCMEYPFAGTGSHWKIKENKE